MSLNGSGIYLVNSAGQPVVANTLITAAAFNAFTADIATALSTAIFKDGQSTVTANIPMGGYRFTGLGAGLSAGQSLRYEQLFTTGAVQLLGALDMVTGAAIASAGTVNLTTATGNGVHITGTTTITAVTLGSGMWRLVIFDGILTLTHHATNNNLPGGANVTTAAGDRALYWADGTTVYCAAYQRANGYVVVPDGTAAAPSVKVGDEQNGLFSPAANQLGFAVAGGVEAILNSEGLALGSGAAPAGVGLHIENGGAAPKVRIKGTGGATEYIDIYRDSATGQFAFDAAQASFGGFQFRTDTGSGLTKRVVVTNAGAIATGSAAHSTGIATGFTSEGDITLPVSGGIRSRSSLSAWARHDSAGGLTRILNVGSVTKNSAGDFTMNITGSVMADGNFGFFCGVRKDDGNAQSPILIANPTATSVRYRNSNATGGAIVDADSYFAAVIP